MIKINLKSVILFETIVIIALVVTLIWMYPKTQQEYLHSKGEVRLLSPRVYANILPPESYLILNWNPLRDFINDYITSQELNVSVYVLNMRDSASFGINVDEGFEPASLNKLPIAMIILKKVEEGKLSLDTKLPIYDKDKDSKSGTLYAEPVNELSVKDLLYRMLSESDNTAAMVLAEQITTQDIQSLSSYLDYYDKDTGYTYNTPLTPRSVSHIFSSLYLSTTLKSEHSEMILSFLTNTPSFDIKKYANLPEDIIVAHKYGIGENCFNDCGILYIQDSRIFYCVMDNNQDQTHAAGVIGTIVNSIYRYVVEAKKLKDLNI